VRGLRGLWDARLGLRWWSRFGVLVRRGALGGFRWWRLPRRSSSCAGVLFRRGLLRVVLALRGSVMVLSIIAPTPVFVGMSICLFVLN
jgi:hypothetical protein